MRRTASRLPSRIPIIDNLVSTRSIEKALLTEPRGLRILADSFAAVENDGAGNEAADPSESDSTGEAVQKRKPSKSAGSVLELWQK